MNVLVICIDTLRWDHCSYTGQVPPLSAKKRPVITPNIDRLARRATVFDRAIIGSFPTIPMRTDAFTGNVGFPRHDWRDLEPGEIILTEVLREAGYYTAFVHDTSNMERAGFGRGFHENIFTHVPPPGAPSPDEIPCPVPIENIRQNGRQRQSQLAGMAHFKKEADWYVAQTMTQAAEWLERNARREKWFLWVDTFEVHEVWHTPQYYVDLYDPNYEGLDYDFPRYGYTDIYTKKELRHLWAHYAAEVTLTDRWIGRLLDQMDVMQLWDDTMAVFISDHGMAIGEHKRAGKHTVAGDADPWPTYEEISHIPLLVWVPGRRGLKKRVKALAQPADLMPTILDVTGVKGPKMHGKSWLPLMTGKAAHNWETVYSSKHGAPKTKLSLTPTRLVATTERWTYVARESEWPAELYDLKADPGQTRNLARKEPELCARFQKECVGFLREQKAIDEYVAKFE